MVLQYVGDHVFKQHSSVCPKSCNLQRFLYVLLIMFSKTIVNCMSFGTWLNYMKIGMCISPTGRLADRSLVVVVVVVIVVVAVLVDVAFIVSKLSSSGLMSLQVLSLALLPYQIHMGVPLQ